MRAVLDSGRSFVSATSPADGVLAKSTREDRLPSTAREGDPITQFVSAPLLKKGRRLVVQGKSNVCGIRIDDDLKRLPTLVHRRHSGDVDPAPRPTTILMGSICESTTAR